MHGGVLVPQFIEVEWCIYASLVLYKIMPLLSPFDQQFAYTNHIYQYKTIW